ncbi:MULTISPECIES: bifunctional DNA-formamidopyrimidine glycosylase/DNA-(apurinic or apyrimidinic site) lyase [Brevibacterium]|uniref:bifunctional DNA-formamidopyrimidine glycosylase/DNA-(apurinic or apyrimidinic site) lyase n=1 Tax=Brevibacterium TaxID=1696 RepID=UPI0031DE3064
MPELPEVESVRRGLAEWTTGALITGAEVIDHRILGTTSARRIDPGLAADFTDRIVGERITGAERRGKFMWLTVGGESGLLVHLGMSGQMRVHPSHAEVHRHTRAVFRLEKGGDFAAESSEASAPERYDLRFIDQRIFGHLSVQPLALAHGRLVPASAIHIAPDPLEDSFDLDAVVDALARKRTPLKAALLDQTVVSGIGNIYADEALFRAGVHPLAIASRTRRSRLVAVVESAASVMGDALAVGGTSFDALYVNVNGESGYFDRALLAYGRDGQECVRCGTEIAKLTVGGRGSHFCPTCQRMPRYR